ncbi:GNAT family N-acetyltransferase [Telluribacter sp.]|jgi:hypothetical protein|uniref:GNAT family N-acetyltransferase n=1 Tax=Telluribacter sp. TaxID=1978767 RepID=UPI002E157468|nr:GNAT family N-acetyltransferase [Telluribacter sp.]
MSNSPEIVHEPDNNQFVIHTDFGEAVQMYEWEDGAMAIMHTEVPVELEGQGLGTALAKYTLEYIEEQGLKIKPYCLFMEEYIEAHAPQYKHLIADDFDPDAKINE